MYGIDLNVHLNIIMIMLFIISTSVCSSRRSVFLFFLFSSNVSLLVLLCHSNYKDAHECIICIYPPSLDRRGHWIIIESVSDTSSYLINYEHLDFDLTIIISNLWLIIGVSSEAIYCIAL